MNLLTNKDVSFFSLFIACAFGLIHGFGFGGFLFEVGFSEEKLLKALVGFNLGVEVGQILAVSIFFILLSWINKLNFNYLPKKIKCQWRDLNSRPQRYECCALTG